MRKKDSDVHARSRVLVLVDESNVSSSVRTVGRGLDWLKLRDFLAGPNTGRDLIEMVVYAGLPPAIPARQEAANRPGRRRKRGISKRPKFRMRPRQYRIDRSPPQADADAGHGFVQLLRRGKQANVEAYGTQQRQR